MAKILDKSTKGRILHHVTEARYKWTHSQGLLPISDVELRQLVEAGAVSAEAADTRRKIDSVTRAFDSLRDALQTYYTR